MDSGAVIEKLPPKTHHSLSLFKVDKLMSLTVKKSAFCENGLRKLLAVVGNETLLFHYTSPSGSHCQLNYSWDFSDYPIQNVCFEPSGTWLLIICHASFHLLPFLSLFEPDGSYDQKWLLNDMTTIKMDSWFITSCVAAVWWLNKALQHILIIGEQSGDIIFYSLDDCVIVGNLKVPSEISDLQICVDDSLDFITLLISSDTKQWRLVLEHRSMNYNWLEPTTSPAAQETPSKKEGLMASLKQFGAEKMAMLSQRRPPAQTEEVPVKTISYTRQPVPYTVKDFQLTKMWDISLTEFENGWTIGPQHSDGRHFVSAFNQTLNALILQSVEGGGAAHVLKIRRDSSSTHLYEKSKVLWCQRLLYLFAGNRIEIHSTYFASETSMELCSSIWEHDLEGTILRGWRVAPYTHFPSGALANLIGPKPPQIFLDRCLITTTEGVYMVSTISDPCEWLVGVICSTVDVNISVDQHKASTPAPLSPCDSEDSFVTPTASPKHCSDEKIGIGGMGEYACSALAAPVREIVRAAATLLLASGAMSKATRLYRICLPSMSGWAEVAGALGRWRAVAACPAQQYERNSKTNSEDLLPHALARLLLDTTDVWRKNTFEELVVHIKRWDCIAGASEIWTACSALGAWKQLKSLEKHYCSVSIPLCNVNPHKADDEEETKEDIPAEKYICRGGWSWLLATRGGVRRFFKNITKKCSECSTCEQCTECGKDKGLKKLLQCVRDQQHLYDDDLLKEICLWICPFQEELRPLMKTFIVGYGRCLANELQMLISTFLSVCCTICSRNAPPLLAAAEISSPREATLLSSKRDSENDVLTLSCSTNWWGIAYTGVVQFGGSLPAGVDDFDFCGLNVLTVACGRDHALLLTTEGLYSAGDNRFGQLGCGWFGGGGGWSLVVGGVRLSSVLDVSAGQYHSAAVTSSGSVYTWGWGVHGQLGHGGAADDESLPRKVALLADIKTVKCGAHHTAVLGKDHNVWIWGAGVFGQLGNGRKDKSSIPLRVDLGVAKVTSISAGHFHTLAVTEDGEVWSWGCSPQSLRMGSTSRRLASAQSKSSQNPPSPTLSTQEIPLPKEQHLSPRSLDISNVIGKVDSVSGGWNHSCIVDDRGHLYIWGLNLDGQLGTNDRKEVLLPSKVNLVGRKKQDDLEEGNPSAVEELNCITAGCGGDFTFAVDLCGTIFKTGNRHDLKSSDPVRVVKMKSSNRTVRLPRHTPSDLTFQMWSHLKHFVTSEAHIISQSEMVQVNENPLRSSLCFSNFQWVDLVLSGLSSWIKEETLSGSPFMMARLFLLRGNYEKLLEYQLMHCDDCLTAKPDAKYLLHGAEKLDRVEIARKILTGRIKDVCKSLLNEETPAACEKDLYSPLKCLCNEETVELVSYYDKIYGCDTVVDCVQEKQHTWWSATAAMMALSPDSVTLADTLVKWYHERRSLDSNMLESNDIKMMEHALKGAGGDSAAEIALFSTVSSQFEGLLSPEFYLTQCDSLFNKW